MLKIGNEWSGNCTFKEQILSQMEYDPFTTSFLLLKTYLSGR